MERIDCSVPVTHRDKYTGKGSRLRIFEPLFSGKLGKYMRRPLASAVQAY